MNVGCKMQKTVESLTQIIFQQCIMPNYLMFICESLRILYSMKHNVQQENSLEEFFAN